MLSKNREEKTIDLCRKLIMAKSYSGQEKEAAEVLKTFFSENQFDEILTDSYGNIIGKIKGNRPGPKLLFDGHIDTVEVPDSSKWTHNPFGAEIIDGKIYGRGASDMKGADSAMANAAVQFAIDNKKDFAGELYIAGVVHEECFEGVAARKISESIKPDYVIIGEASNLDLKIGQRGRGEIKIETFGVPAHSANPEKGINAVYAMCKVIEKLQAILIPHDDFLGDGILELTDIKSSPYPGASVVPDYCVATYDRRLLVGETKESVLKPIQESLMELMKSDKRIKAKVSFSTGKERCYTGTEIHGERFFPGWAYNQNDEYIHKILKSLNEDGFSPKVTKYNFCTNGSHYAGEAHIKTIGLGPSTESLAHTIDEYIEIEQLLKATECYMSIMKALL